MSARRGWAVACFLLVAGAAMAAPGGFTLTNPRRVCTNGTPSLAFNWTVSSGATSYSVVRDGVTIATTTATAYDDPAVTPAQSYTYSVIATDATGSTPSANSVTMTAPYCQAPEPPTLTAAVICHFAQPAVELNWTESARAETYDVYKNGIRIRTNLPATTTSLIDTSVTAGTTVSYFVRPMNVGTISPQPPPTSPSDSNTVTVMVTNPCPPPPAAPAVSTSAFCGTAAGLPSPKVTVTWTAPAGATSYSVFRNDQSLLSTTSTGYEDPNVNAGSSYTYTVYAHGEGGQSTPGTSTITVPANICSPPPGAPVLQASNICTPLNAAAVQLTWSAAANATSYTVFRNSTAVASGITSTSYQDMPTLGASHTYVVRAVNDSGTADSAPVTITAADVCPRPPGAFTSSVSVFCANNAPGVRVTWTASSGASTYSVLRNGTSIASGLTGTSYDDTSVTDGATYSYVVRATNNTGTTDTASSSVTVADPCPRPPGTFTVTGHSYCSGASPAVHLSWTVASGALQYSVLRNDAVIASNVSGTTFDDTAVAAGTSYSYVVRALNANGSTDSSPFSITPGPCNVEVPRADLVVSSIALSPTTAAAGDTIEVTYTAVNNGTAAAGETQTRIRIGTGSAPGPDDVLVLGTATQPIAAGGSRVETHSIVIPSLPGGTYTVFVSLNDDRAVDESTFANNVEGARLDVTQEQCQVSCLVSAPVQAVVGQNVAFSLLDPPSCPASVTWQFGNNTSGGGEAASATYNAVGVYNWTVVVTATDGSSCANAGTIEITAPPRNPRRRAVRK